MVLWNVSMSGPKVARVGVDEPALRWRALGEGVDVDRGLAVHRRDDGEVVVGAGYRPHAGLLEQDLVDVDSRKDSVRHRIPAPPCRPPRGCMPRPTGPQHTAPAVAPSLSASFPGRQPNRADRAPRQGVARNPIEYGWPVSVFATASGTGSWPGSRRAAGRRGRRRRAGRCAGPPGRATRQGSGRRHRRAGRCAADRRGH